MNQPITVILILLGIISVLAARVIAGVEAHPPLLPALLETLGVTVATVLTVKLIYEKFVAKQHFETFLGLLKSELGNFQDLTGISLRLGIREEFSSRIAYQQRYSIAQIISAAPSGSRFQCIGKTLFHILNQSEVLYSGLQKNLTIELCLADPKKHTSIAGTLTDTYIEDINAGMKSLKLLAERLNGATITSGSIEVRTHSFMLWDSFTLFSDQEAGLTVIWDLSFGRDLSQKRVFVLDGKKPLGEDLIGRYNRLWSNSEKQLVFKNGKVELNKLALG